MGLDEAEPAHRIVSQAKNAAAFRKISRSSRSGALSFRKRINSATLASNHIGLGPTRCCHQLDGLATALIWIPPRPTLGPSPSGTIIPESKCRATGSTALVAEMPIDSRNTYVTGMNLCAVTPDTHRHDCTVLRI